MMWYPIHAINLNLLQVKGRSDLFLRLEIIKKILGVTVLCLTVPFGLKVMCYGQIVNSIVALSINTNYTGKLINVGFIRQIKDLFPTLVLSLSMFVVVIGAIHFVDANLLKLVIGIFVGIFYYLTISYLMNFPELTEVLKLIKRK